MVFSSLTFLFLFLPLVLLLYYILPGIRAKNILLLVASLLFYAWGEPVYVLLMVATALINWACGLLMERGHKGLWCALAVVFDLGCLVVFKYTGFLVENPDRMPDIHIHGNDFSDFPAFRLSGAGKIRFENNVISDCMAAIKFYDLAVYWYESGRIRDARVTHNRLTGCNKLGGDAFIDIRVSGFEPEKAPLIHDRIEISDNTFEKIQKYAVRACGVKELVVKDNTLDGAPFDESKILHIRKA